MNGVISCPSCPKKYRLTGPQPASFVCRGCGAEIAIPRPAPALAVPSTEVAEASAEDGAEGASCRACGARLAEGARFCDGCGKAVDGTAKRHRSRDDPMLRRLASRELGRATRAIGAVKVLCITYAVFQAITLAFLLWVRSETVHRAGASPLLLDLLVAASGVMLVLLLSAIAFLRTQPFLWTVVLAGLQTLYLAGALVGKVGGIPLVVIIVNTLGLWAAVSVTSRVSRLLREFPDLRVALRMTQGSHAGRPRGMGSRFADEARADKRRFLLRAGLVAGAVVAVGVGLVLLRPGPPERPPPPPDAPGFEGALARFSSDWGSSNLAALRAAMMDDRRARLWDRIVERRGWKDALPPIEAPVRISQLGDEGFAAFPLREESAGELRVQFAYQDARWVVRGIQFPRE